MMEVHAELVARASAWLRRDRSNLVVITEMVTENSETPDAIAFSRTGSTLVECKAQRGDFLRDKRKAFRRGDYPAMGRLRYYLCPEGLIAKDELPEGWGLLWVVGRGIQSQWPSRMFPRSIEAEMRMLLSAFRRLGPEPARGISVRHYLWPTKCRATLGTRRSVANEPQH